MIGKVPRPGRGFRGIVSYLLHGSRRGDPDAARIAWTATRNLIIEDPERAPQLMRMTAAKSVRVVRPVYHFVISWHRDEAPSPDLMRQIADATCHDLGLDDHQRLYIAHQDTEHPHVHIVANRVHPETGLAWQTSHDYRRIERSLARQARELGLKIVPGRHNGMSRQPPKPRRPRDATFHKTRRLNRPRWSNERVASLRPLLQDLFTASYSWEDIRKRLEAVGLQIERKGQGLTIVGTDGEIKLSEIGRGISLRALESTFGSLFLDPTNPRDAARQTLLVRRRRDREK